MQTTENDAFSWSENTQWVAEAKKRGLDCGTTSIASQNKIVASTQSQNRQILQNTNRREIYSSSSNNNSRGASSEIHKAKCKKSASKCFLKAQKKCGNSYQVVDSESHAGGEWADILPGPVTWFSFRYRCGLSDGTKPTFPFEGPQFSGGFVSSETTPTNTTSDDDDGSSTTTYRANSTGTRVYGSDGTTYRSNSTGSRWYGSDGSSYRSNSTGTRVFGSDGTTYRQRGNTTYGSDGSSCRTTTSGRYTYCN